MQSDQLLINGGRVDDARLTPVRARHTTSKRICKGGEGLAPRMALTTV